MRRKKRWGVLSKTSRSVLFTASYLCESLPVNSKLFALTQRAVDFFTVLSSFALGFGFYLRGGRSVPYDFFQFLSLGALTGVLFLVVFHSLRLYESKTSLLHVVETRRLLIGWALGSLILFSLIFFFLKCDVRLLLICKNLVICKN